MVIPRLRGSTVHFWVGCTRLIPLWFVFNFLPVKAFPNEVELTPSVVEHHHRWVVTILMIYLFWCFLVLLMHFVLWEWAWKTRNFHHFRLSFHLFTFNKNQWRISHWYRSCECELILGIDHRFLVGYGFPPKERLIEWVMRLWVVREFHCFVLHRRHCVETFDFFY